eukprot:Lithocolla_globosa_v1_NODE_4774_length_1369_cov_32.773212.p2 type:complete len:151 gc:universal NODE_4774_length_1369_cov_32.773212:360-812(+)
MYTKNDIPHAVADAFQVYLIGGRVALVGVGSQNQLGVGVYVDCAHHPWCSQEIIHNGLSLRLRGSGRPAVCVRGGIGRRPYSPPLLVKVPVEVDPIRVATVQPILTPHAVRGPRVLKAVRIDMRDHYHLNCVEQINNIAIACGILGDQVV